MVVKTAQPAPEKTTEKPPEPTITIAEVKPPGIIHGVDHIEKAGDMVVEEFKPSEEDLARLAKAQATIVSGQAQPAPEPPKPAVIVAPSRAKQTMAEMERGAAVVKEKTAQREKMQAAAGR